MDIMATVETRADGNRTPSPQGPFGSLTMGGNSSEGDVPSPVPASISSTTSSDPSLSQHGSSHHLNHQVYAAVPNPFATSAGAPAAPIAPAPAGWGTHAYETAAPAPAVPQPLHAPYHLYQQQQQQQHGPIPMVVSAHAPTYHNSPAMTPTPMHPISTTAETWSRLNSCPNFSIGSTEPKSPSTSHGRGGTKASGSRRRYGTKTASNNSLASTAESGSDVGGVGDSVNSRRQKRLERNRESARLSRRRRKQYLEILEEKVTQLSHELDSGRRAHASQAVTVVSHKRREILEAPDISDEEKIRILDHGLGRNSAEMMLVTTFKHQQLKSFSLPPQSKFILWLTLQNDQYFRGGRAASERLSAARIGERMLNSGNDRVPPAQSMWPLFCNEVGLSYDQEERVRSFQRALLQSEDSWLQRHQARAADLAMQAVHDSTQAMSLRLGQRERTMLSVLTPAQKVKFLSFAERNREKLQRIMQGKVKKHMEATKNPFIDERFKIDKKQHVAANLYIINHQLGKLMQYIPRATPLATGATLKKLSRRPSFESLGRAALDKLAREGGDDCMSPETSFASSGSLKHSTSVLSMDGDRPQMLQISPDDAEETCKPSVEKVLGYIREIIPALPPPQYCQQPQMDYSSQPQAVAPTSHPQQVYEIRIPSPAHVISTPYQPSTALQPNYTQAPLHHAHPLSQQVPIPMMIVSSQPAGEQQHHHPEKHAPGHKKQSSFIPPYLNVVPEEMFPNDGTAEDFLMSLVDEDWAIGEGIDMDTSP